MSGAIVTIVVAIFAMFIIAKIIRVVPQQQAWVVERLGKYSGTLDAGLHILMPSLDVVRYKHSLKEIALDVPEQTCITKDNGRSGDAFCFKISPERLRTHAMIVGHPADATNLRREIGKSDLDRTFEERTKINTEVVTKWKGLDRGA